MAWETRNGRRYYYRKVRRGGRVFSVYEGGGVSGQVSAEAAASERVVKQARALTMREQAARDDAIDAKIDESWRMVLMATTAALESAGFHQHKGQWRLKR
jgi:hypothetical protein